MYWITFWELQNKKKGFFLNGIFYKKFKEFLFRFPTTYKNINTGKEIIFQRALINSFKYIFISKCPFKNHISQTHRNFKILSSRSFFKPFILDFNERDTIILWFHSYDREIFFVYNFYFDTFFLFLKTHLLVNIVQICV